MPTTGFDYVIAGAGAAGCVIARRLIERTDATVLLLEAGGADDRAAVHATDIASLISLWNSPDITWPYQTTAQPGCLDREIPIVQGKLIGGSSSVNAMLYVRGNRRDFDRWADLGNEGWSYQDLLPCFQRAEHYPAGDPRYRGTGGPLQISDYGPPSEIAAAFLQAAKETGYTADGSDYNGAQQENAAFLYQSARTADNRRCSVADGYLRPVLGHPRLVVTTGAQVTGIMLRDGRAAGVEYLARGRSHQVTAAAEVIVACGAFGSPRLLMLSGIGPADELREHGIAAAADLPGVGRNLQDHLIFGVGWECTAPQRQPRLLAEAGLFLHSRVTAPAASPDLQFLAGPVQFFDDRYKTEGPAFTFAPVLVQPRSRGTVRLRSADPLALPAVDPRYLTTAADVNALVAGIAIARELAHANSFAGLRGRELAPGADVTDRASLIRYVRESAATIWHPAGTCRMGRDALAVIDPQLRVHGVAGLRVADASIMPAITAGNTEAPVVAIAEKAADLLTGRA